MPDLDPLAQGQHGKDRGQDGGHRLAQHEDLPLRETVRHHAGPRAEEQGRQELQGHGDADGGDGTGELEHQPVLGDPLHPERNHGDEVPDREDAEVADLQRNEGVAPGQALIDDGEWLGDGVRQGSCGRL